MSQPTWNHETYEMVAEQIRANVEETRAKLPDSLDRDRILCGMEDIASNLADNFSADNPSFERSRQLDEKNRINPCGN